MIESAIGIILRTRPLTETSLIVNWLTAEHGRISTVAKGARRPKSTYAGKLDLFYEAEFSFTRSKRSELHTLRELSLKQTHSPLRLEMGWLQQASYATALIEQTTERDTPLPTIHTLLQGLLAYLPMHPAQPRTVYAFELKLLNELGLHPESEGARLSALTRATIEVLTGADWNDLARMTATAAQARELRQFLHEFLVFHLGRIPKGRP